MPAILLAVISMLFIITMMLGFYMLLKGMEILMIALASSREDRKMLIIVGGVTLAIAVIAGGLFVSMQMGQVGQVQGAMAQEMQAQQMMMQQQQGAQQSGQGQNGGGK